MNKLIIVLVLFIAAYGCTGGNTGKEEAANNKHPDSLQTESTTSVARGANNNSPNGIPDFLKFIDNETTSFRGILQGVANTDSAGPYVCSEYFSDTLSFEILYYPINQKKELVNFDSIRKASTNDFSDYTCFAFVYPMKDPDYHSSSVIYPVHVKSYVRKDKQWEFLLEEEVNNLTELSRHKIKCIYSVVKK